MEDIENNNFNVIEDFLKKLKNFELDVSTSGVTISTSIKGIPYTIVGNVSSEDFFADNSSSLFEKYFIGNSFIKDDSQTKEIIKSFKEKYDLLLDIPIVEKEEPMSLNAIYDPNAEIPILYDDRFGYYFIIKGPVGDIKFYINYFSTIEENTVVYDYFGSGELFVNLPNGSVISGVNQATADFILQHFFIEPDSRFKQYPETSDIDLYGIAKSVSGLNNGMNAWAFKADYLFRISQSNIINSTPDNVPICKFYTNIDEQKNGVISEKYRFANYLPNTPCCSAPSTDSYDFAYLCQMNMSNQRTCSSYEPRIEVPVSLNVRHTNTSNVTELSVVHMINNNLENIFKIVEKETGNPVNTIKVPNGTDYNTALEEVKRIAQDYISCYEEPVVESIAESDIPEKDNGFINSLLIEA